MVFTSQQTLLFDFDISFNTGQAYVLGCFSLHLREELVS
jgi:hypothetical protein